MEKVWYKSKTLWGIIAFLIVETLKIYSPEVPEFLRIAEILTIAFTVFGLRMAKK